MEDILFAVYGTTITPKMYRTREEAEKCFNETVDNIMAEGVWAGKLMFQDFAHFTRRQEYPGNDLKLYLIKLNVQ